MATALALVYNVQSMSSRNRFTLELQFSRRFFLEDLPHPSAMTIQTELM